MTACHAMRALTATIACLTIAWSSLAAQAKPCCSITALPAVNGVVTARVTATGATFEFKANDARVLRSLKVGQTIYANFTTHQVSLDGKLACCTVTKDPVSPPTVARTPAVVGATLLPHLVSISVDPVVTGGRELHGTVVIDPPAPSGPQGMPIVTLSASPAQLVQFTNGQRVNIPPGASQGRFTVLSAAVASRTAATISATFNNTVRSDTFALVPPALLSITVSPTTIGSGDTARATITFTGPPAAANQVVATLSISNPALVRAPASVALAPNHNAVQIDLISNAAGESTPVQVSATWGTSRNGTPRTATAVLTVSPVAVAAAGSCFSPCLPYATIYAKLPVAAPSGGLRVFFSSPDLSFPQGDAITIPAGADSGGIAASIEGRQVTGFPAQTLPVDVSYNGHLYHGAGLTVWPEGKPDLAIWKMVATDHLGNDITSGGPVDGQPFTVCAYVSQVGSPPDDYYWLTEPAGPSQLHLSYLDNHGLGHEFNLATDFSSTGGGFHYVVPVCGTLPGLASVNDYVTISFSADVNNQVKEKDEGNNSRQYRITRKH